MTKRLLTTCLLFVGIMASSQAFASRATELVLGTGDGGYMLNSGSLFYDEAYNVFYNPAYVNDYKNWGTIEKSNFPGLTAQGGFVASVMNLNVGVYFNRGDFVMGSLGNAGTGAGSIVAGNPSLNGATPAAGAAWSSYPLRPIELMVGSDLGTLKWGIGLGYAGAQIAAGNSDQYHITAGVEVAGVEPFLTYSGGADPTYNHSLFRVGARYHWGEWVPYAAFLQNHDTLVSSSSTGVKETNMGLGLGRSSKVAEGVRMNYAVSIWSVKDAADGGAPTDSSRLTLPIDFSLEGDANSWLTLRAGLGYHLYDRAGLSNGEKLSVSDMTTGRIGGTIHAGKADFDFAVGKLSLTNETGSPATGNNGVSETSNTADAQVLDFGNGFFAAAAFTYHW